MFTRASAYLVTSLFILGCLALGASLVGCTEQKRARTFGGTATQQVIVGHKVVGVAWKGSNLWVLTRPMHETEVPETLVLKEHSSLGLVEGTVTLVERDSMDSLHMRELHQEQLKVLKASQHSEEDLENLKAAGIE